MADQKLRGVVDLVILLDITGSMQHCIDALKENINGFFDLLTEEGPNNSNPIKDFRAKVVGYRDVFFEKEEEAIVDNPFTRDVGELRAQLGNLKADGGGDEPESLLDGLERVARMEASAQGVEDPSKWRYRRDAARVVVIFTDASFHPKTKGGAAVGDIEALCLSNRILISLFAPEMDCHFDLSGIDKAIYKPIPYDKADKWGAAKALEAFTRDKANFENTLRQLAKSVSASADVEIL